MTVRDVLVFVALNAFLVLSVFSAPGANATTIVSFLRSGGSDVEGLGGSAASVNPGDAVDIDIPYLVFDEIPEVQFEDVDGFHDLGGGILLFSPSTSMGFGFKDLSDDPRPGDIIRYDSNTDTASLFFNQDTFTGASNIDAFSILPNGNLILSTQATASLPGLASFADGDVVEWNGTTASLFVAESSIFQDQVSQSNENIDALHAVSATEIIFSVWSNGVGQIGSNFSYDTLNVLSSDLVSYETTSNLGGEFLDGEDLWDGNVTRNLNAAHVPEPGTILLAGLGLTGLAAAGRRRSAL